ncbi:MAG TPA: bifunctional DNA-formamidopyrimidine glycosylase/DNA-(apurinic or apyrimidinic site) lyase [Patescibacteria group bacterium]
MPELPEVETIKLGLQKYLVGHTLVEIELRLPKQFHGDKAQAIGAKILAIRRFGKGLVIDLDNQFSLAIHVKMTGQLIYDAGEKKLDLSLPDKYTHIIFHLDHGATLYYRDVRQFGWVKVVPTVDILDLPFFKNLGKEPLKDLTLDYFRLLIKRYQTPIKQLLMEQRKVAGIGNIYANDALYLAKIHPKRKAASLTDQEIKQLFIAVETVLQKGIKTGGASERDYVNAIGGKGSYQKYFQVYKKTGQPCRRCGTIIERITQGGRGTFFCPICQR